MAQSVATQYGDEPNPLDTTSLCLLSLDGGGVRGPSTLDILKGLMSRLDNERQIARLLCVKPCEVFDLIGGTSVCRLKCFPSNGAAICCAPHSSKGA
jgi:hypothetical protein